MWINGDVKGVNRLLRKSKIFLKFFLTTLLLVAIAFVMPTAVSEKVGDVNGDGNITSVDALITLKMAVGKLEANPIADISGDGKISSFDAFKILQIAIGVENSTLDEIAKILNSKGFASLFGNERMNWEVEMKDGRKVYYAIVVENGEIKEISEGKLDNPTLRGYITEETIEKIKNSEDWIETAKKALDSGEIKIEGVGIVNQIKVGVMSFASKISGLFGIG